MAYKSYKEPVWQKCQYKSFCLFLWIVNNTNRENINMDAELIACRVYIWWGGREHVFKKCTNNKAYCLMSGMKRSSCLLVPEGWWHTLTLKTKSLTFTSVCRRWAQWRTLKVGNYTNHFRVTAWRYIHIQGRPINGIHIKEYRIKLQVIPHNRQGG